MHRCAGVTFEMVVRMNVALKGGGDKRWLHVFTEGTGNLGRAWLAWSGVLIPAPVGRSEVAGRWLVLPAQQASVRASFLQNQFQHSQGHTIPPREVYLVEINFLVSIFIASFRK